MLGSSERRVEKHCKIINWLKIVDNEFAEHLGNLCMVDILSVNPKYTSSITFLMPNKKLLEKIYESDVEKASQIISSCVIPFGVATSQAFENFSKADNLGNKAYYHFPEILESDKTSITFKNGLKISSDPKSSDNSNITKYGFIGREKKEKKIGISYVWYIVKGEPPHADNSKDAKSGYKLPQGNRVKKGGEETTFSKREALTSKLYDIFRAALNNTSVGYSDIFTRACIVIFNNLLKDTCQATFVKVRPIIDINPIVTYFLIVEPYKQHNYLLQDDQLFRNLDNEAFLQQIQTMSETDVMEKYLDIINKDLRCVDNESAIYNQTNKIVSNVIKIRDELLNQNFQISSILSYYNSLETTNILGYSGTTIAKIFPDALFVHYSDKVNKNKKLWQDEVRFVIHGFLSSMRLSYGVERIATFNKLMFTMQKEMPGNNYTDELCILNVDKSTTFNGLIACQRTKLQVMQHFVNSSCFLFIGCNLPLSCRLCTNTSEEPMIVAKQQAKQQETQTATPEKTSERTQTVKQESEQITSREQEQAGLRTVQSTPQSIRQASDIIAMN